jgi:DNA-binding NtrC family response regulator
LNHDATLDAALARCHVAPDSPLADALARAVDAAARPGRVTLPRIDGVRGEVVARWVHRVCAERDGFAPLHIVDTAHLSPDATPTRWWRAARGAFAFVHGDPSHPELDGFWREVDDGAICALTEDASGAVFSLDGHAREAMRAWDDLHGVACDPGLAQVRRALRAHTLAGSVVLLRGEPATGRRALTHWAAASANLRAVRTFEDLARLDPDALDALRADLTRLHARPRRRAWAPPPGPRPEGLAFSAIAGESSELVELLGRVATLAPTGVPVLVTGEPGVGKELVARALHDASGRAGAFVALDVGTLTSSLAASALFGHVRGAFTGAERAREGAFRAAHGGTLFLDELGNLPLDVQVQLLRALQERCVVPVGADAPVPVDVRVVCATNQDLREMCRRGTFRLDLLGRVDAATCHVPPLRERLGDLDALATALLARHGRAHLDPWCTPDARRLLESHAWPGNVRELEHTLSLAAALAPPDAPIDAPHLGELARRLDAAGGPVVVTAAPDGDPTHAGLTPHLARALEVNTLRVPPLRDRPADAIRQALLSHLGGRPITQAALTSLERLAWWGNLTEVRQRLAPLAVGRGVVDLDALDALMPDALGGHARGTLHVLQSPTRTGGRIVGARWTLDAASLLVGRASHVRELEHARRAGDARAAAWLDALEEPGGAAPACVTFPLLDRLSRAHVQVAHAPGGLTLRRLPHTRLAVLAGDVHAPLTELAPGERVHTGPAAELRVLRRDGSVYLQLFVFAHALALAAHEDDALTRAQAVRDGMLATADLTHDRRPAKAGKPGRVWTLSDFEAELVTDLVAGYLGGSFTRHVRDELDTLRTTPKCHRLVRYLDAAPRPPQYLTRLCEKADNAHVRAALRARFAHATDRDDRVAMLPVGLRRIVGTKTQNQTKTET